MNIAADTPRPLDTIKERIAVLERFENKIRIALHHGQDVETFDQFCVKVIGGTAIMHTTPNAALFCDLSKYGGGVAYNVYVAVGELSEIIEYQRTHLIREAKARGCNALSFTGRQGWRRVLEKEGWHVTLISMAKEIGDE